MRATRPVLIDLSPQWLMATREILNLTLGTFPSTAESGGLLQLELSVRMRSNTTMPNLYDGGDSEPGELACTTLILSFVKRHFA